MANRNLTWREIKLLNEIYNSESSGIRISTTSNVKSHNYIAHLISKEYILSKGYSCLKKGGNFDYLYEHDLLQNFITYKNFLDKYELATPQCQLAESEIQTLIIVEGDKDIIKDGLLSSRSKFGTRYFKGAKVIKKNSALERAIFKILDIDKFPADETDKQYLSVINCPTPKMIVLCENIDFLRVPSIARENHIELWYAGGNNIEKLNHIPQRDLPIYYSCDWDDEGLHIYQRIKEKESPINAIQLLYPYPLGSAKTVNSPDHSSQWDRNDVLSGLNSSFFNDSQITLINQLISDDYWIEEEDNDLLAMLHFNNAI